ncbi:Polygalacturonase QRT3-like protein [Melia azedarach]|uniref:Polygalacturonase QRT3-like protein n=1 Tax=Melia azedarach TaxID=155640 RepID=A0ACC1WUK5_MELAZ|nr:Polygalacturonase QRT3-like protein [Melia azedarach]
MKKHFLALCFILCLLASQTTSISEKKLSQLMAKHQAASSSRGSTPLESSNKNNGRVFYPIGYGADPTGGIESSDAILQAVNDALQVQSGLQLLTGIKDLGGVIVDLQGGNYTISKPIRFPAGYGNLVVQGGSLRASSNFPVDRHLIELWAPNSQNFKQQTESITFHGLKDQNGGIYYEDITFRDILFDSSYTGGGLFIIDSARIRINNCFFLHFTTQGILVEKGHETFISNSFLGQHSTVGGDPAEKDFSGTGIELASNDNAITDVVIFSAAIGVLLRGQANIVTGVHCYNKATGFGGIGILVKVADASLTRIDNCYLDYTGIVLEDPVQVHITNGFFLGDANIVLKSIKGRISGVNIVENMFNGSPQNNVPIVNLDGEFSNIDQVVIHQNNVNGMRLKSTAGKLLVAGNGTKWVADFSPILVFPNRIIHFQYSMYVEGGFAAHGVTNVSNNVVVVESDKPVNGIVSVAVDQYNMLMKVSYRSGRNDQSMGTRESFSSRKRSLEVCVCFWTIF